MSSQPVHTPPRGFAAPIYHTVLSLGSNLGDSEALVALLDRKLRCTGPSSFAFVLRTPDPSDRTKMRLDDVDNDFRVIRRGGQGREGTDTRPVDRCFVRTGLVEGDLHLRACMKHDTLQEGLEVRGR